MTLQPVRLEFVPGIGCLVLFEHGLTCRAERATAFHCLETSRDCRQNGKHRDRYRDLRNKRIALVRRMLGMLGMFMRVERRIMCHCPLRGNIRAL